MFHIVRICEFGLVASSFFGLLFLLLNSSALCNVPYCPTYTPVERRLKMHSSVSHVESACPVGGAISVCLDQ